MNGFLEAVVGAEREILSNDSAQILRRRSNDRSLNLAAYSHDPTFVSVNVSIVASIQRTGARVSR